jgi:RNA polymerase sigma factor (sigma-70 family)
MGIARHKVSDYYRGRLRQPAGWDEQARDVAAENLPTPEEWAEGRQSAERTMAILGDLPEHYRLILLWRYWEQCSARQIAEATGRSEKGVERLLARAREQFKRRWLHE